MNADATAPKRLNIAFGPAGFSYPDWRSALYPQGAGSGMRALRWLADFLDLLEINASFYGPLRQETTAGWLRALDDAPWFRFVAKVWRGFTHEGMDLEPALVALHTAGMRPLIDAGRLAAWLIQFPFSFRASERSFDRLRAIAEALPRGARAIEVRHESWAEDRWTEAFDRCGFATVVIDQPALPGCLRLVPRCTGPLAYLRLHGRNAEAWFAPTAGRDERYDYRYAPDEIEEIARLAREIPRGKRELLIVGNNHFHGKAVAAVLSLVAEICGERLSFPGKLLAADPRLLRWHQKPKDSLF